MTNTEQRNSVLPRARKNAMTAVSTHVSQRGAHCGEAALRGNMSLYPNFIPAICSLFRLVMRAKTSLIRVLTDFNTLQKKHKTFGSLQSKLRRGEKLNRRHPPAMSFWCCLRVLISMLASKLFHCHYLLQFLSGTA